MWAHFFEARSWNWSRYSGAKGEPACACGCVWAKQPQSEITSLTDVPGAIDERVAVARGTSSPRVLAHGEVAARGATSH
jgi:hypothetical protein